MVADFWKFHRARLSPSGEVVSLGVSVHGATVAAVGLDCFTRQSLYSFLWTFYNRNGQRNVNEYDFLKADRLSERWTITDALVWGRGGVLVGRVSLASKVIEDGGSLVRLALTLKEIRALAFSLDMDLRQLAITFDFDFGDVFCIVCRPDGSPYIF